MTRINEEEMRQFQDSDGNVWKATVRERPGPDFKGRFYFYLIPDGEDEEFGVSLLDVRWNSRNAAERTLETMSGVELRRRLRSAVGRSRRPRTPSPRDG